MHIIDDLQNEISKLPFDKTFSFSTLSVAGASKDTIRKYLHRLHERGEISIVKRGEFKRIKPLNELIFIYGSLKKGFDNHHLLERYAKRLGKAKTVGKFAMFEDSFGNYPYIVPKKVHHIEGELYQITRQELLHQLDEFEGAPEFYQRKKILVKSHHGTQKAYVYIRTDAKIPQDQQPLKSWQNNTDYKVQQLQEFLNRLY
ncbi:MAG: gamma-glutamylcyclotransferase [Campylobacterales bacterium]|nr:gamma-glutamylcyclotransferase [Campylobacterales bacterium]